MVVQTNEEHIANNAGGKRKQKPKKQEEVEEKITLFISVSGDNEGKH